jgi:hypothetical protein
MKLIFCSSCQDVFKLRSEIHYCECGKIWGRYKRDGLYAEISDQAIPLGFNNHHFRLAVKNRPVSGLGKSFVAFVIPKDCGTIAVHSEVPVDEPCDSSL